MKPLETNVTAVGPKPVSSDAATSQDPNADLKQRLWQLLLPLPKKAAAVELGAAGANPQTAQQRSREAQSHSAASELAATAYVLAGHLQQLSLFDAVRADVSSAPQPVKLGNNQHGVSVRVDATTSTGGLASVELMHPELGAVELSVELANGAVRVTATADSARSAQVIQQGQALLAQRLLHQGVALEALDVVVRKRKSARPAKRSRQRSREEES
jgi:flagellar hook-length control protein FliK